ncbi:hypothetical protein HF521_011784, partial [Silurus meridionalis]
YKSLSLSLVSNLSYSSSYAFSLAFATSLLPAAASPCTPAFFSHHSVDPTSVLPTSSPYALLHFLIPPPCLFGFLSISRCYTKYFSKCHSSSSSTIIQHLFNTPEPLSDLFHEPLTTLFLLQFPPSYSSFSPHSPPLLLSSKNIQCCLATLSPANTLQSPISFRLHLLHST